MIGYPAIQELAQFPPGAAFEGPAAAGQSLSQEAETDPLYAPENPLEVAPESLKSEDSVIGRRPRSMVPFHRKRVPTEGTNSHAPPYRLRPASPIGGRPEKPTAFHIVSLRKSATRESDTERVMSREPPHTTGLKP